LPGDYTNDLAVTNSMDKWNNRPPMWMIHLLRNRDAKSWPTGTACNSPIWETDLTST